MALMVGAYFIWTSSPWAERTETSGAAGYAIPLQSIAETRNTEPSVAEPSITPSNMPGFTVPTHIADITDTRYLELVNLEYPVKDEPDGSLIGAAWPDVPVRAKEVTLHKTALAAVRELFSAARESHDGTFYISSGYRGYDQQKRTYDNAPDKSFAQPPGHSEHQTGLAADIFIIGIGQHDMAGASEAQWLAENAWKHGLILRYAEGKQNITGIAYEPWHFRYIGQPHAWYCYQNNLCLEEYIQFLKENGGYQTTLDGKTYSVLYQVPQDGIIYLPEHQNFWVSGDNTGGFIVTAWE
ncbi:MAG: M15 family metallopeptidase [Oscillospiraceae bacterium]|nr:M15 family metallopeptidase [Oscillospiraceae bacterium]